jgi:hypothetical protein
MVDVNGGQAGLLGALLRQLDAAGGLAVLDSVRLAEVRLLERRLAAEGRRWLDNSPVDIGKPHFDTNDSDSARSPMPPGSGGWVGTDSARRILGMSRQGIWKRRAELHAHKIDGRWLYPVNALLADNERRAS